MFSFTFLNIKLEIYKLVYSYHLVISLFVHLNWGGISQNLRASTLPLTLPGLRGILGAKKALKAISLITLRHDSS